ncbi:MAG TPA: hypothetical protein VH370_08145 [Humisphaera sp.]|jgi:hypothetical protein|nr:hypothetical protein [Humisphaera sp.]
MPPELSATAKSGGAGLKQGKAYGRIRFQLAAPRGNRATIAGDRRIPAAMDGMLLQLQNLDPTTRWLVIVASVLTLVYVVLRPLRRKKDPLARPSPQPSLAAQRALERDMNALLVELSEMARQITAQLDTRAAKLDLLIKQADERAARLSVSCLNNANEVPPSARHAEVPAAPPIDPRHVEVYVLSDQGHTSGDIAAKLGRPRGEIELILALREPAASL